MAYLIDCSNNNGSVDFHRVRQSGVAGCWMKATEGVTFTDALYAGSAHEARTVGLRVGAYHFAHPEKNSALQEADFFCRVIGKPKRRDLRPVLDFEVKTTLHPVILEGWAHRFCQRVYHNIGVLPLFYSYTAYIEAMRPVKPIGAGLWLADYNGLLHVAAPKPWKHVTVHQYTDKATVLGVRGDCDKSWAPRLRPLLAHPVLGLV